MVGKKLFSLCAILAMFSVHEARAVPISIGGLPFGVSGTFDDEIGNFTLVLSGGPVTGDSISGPFTPNIPGGKWPITFTIVIDDHLFGAPSATQDFVSVSGNIFHDAEPHPPEGNGGVLNFGFLAIAGGITDNVGFDGSVKNNINTTFREHKIHRDKYVGRIRSTQLGNNILNWSLSLEAIHIREPSTLTLLSVALLTFGVFTIILKKRRGQSQL